MYDIIGDIHGHADKLIALLQKMDYQRVGSSWRHPDGRRLVFAGDYIDRGPGIEQVLQTVRACVDAGDADAIMGNHEFNAMAYDCLRADGVDAADIHNWCRIHSEKNAHQYSQTMEQLGKQKRAEWIAWFRTLIPCWEADGIRVVHACWDEQSIQYIRSCLKDGLWTDALIREASDETSQLYAAIDLVFKGLEIELPGGQSYQDKEGTVRTMARVQWWRQPARDEAIGKWLMPPQDGIDGVLGAVDSAQLSIPDARGPITCIGHYWMPPVNHAPIHDKIVCVDYSVAKGGHLCAYRFAGEQIAQANNLVYV